MSHCHDLPIPRKDLQALFAFLNSDKRPACDRTLAATKSFLKRRKLPIEPIVEWLERHGAYCDCEVLMNIWMGGDE